MSLRILGGGLKGRTIITPKVATTRPVTSSLRKSIFDSCQFFIQNACVVDLFAGSGALGLEALSRGAGYAYFIDIYPLPIRSIKENIAKLDLGAKSSVIQGNAFSLFPSLTKPIDILFLDPPYTIGLEGYLKLVELVVEHKSLIQADGHIYLESPSSFAPALKTALLPYFALEKEKKSSTTTLFHCKFLGRVVI